MRDIVLNAKKREKTESLKTLRRNNFVPGIIYGKGKENISVKVWDTDLLKAYRKAWSSTILTMDIDWEKVDVLMHNIQREPVNWGFLHIDFYAITLGQKVTATIKFNFIWKAEAEKEWAIIEENIKEIEVSVLPRNLVDSIDVDLSMLKNVWDMIRIKDLGIDTEKFEISNDLEDLVVMASEPKKVVIEEPSEEEGSEKEDSEEIKEEEAKEEEK